MKLSRSLAYGVAGVIGGLLVENSALVLKQRALKKTRTAQKKVTKVLEHKV